MSDPLEKLGESIPSVYYDLIARVVPGGALIAFVAWGEPKIAALFEKLDPVAATLVGLAASYLAGILLTPLGSIIFEAPVLAASRAYRPARQWAADRLWPTIDHIGRRNPGLAGTLAKMAAEVILCQNLVAATVVSLVSTQLRHAIGPKRWAIWLFFVLLGTIFRTVVLYRRVRAIETAYGTSPPVTANGTAPLHCS